MVAMTRRLIYRGAISGVLILSFLFVASGTLSGQEVGEAAVRCFEEAVLVGDGFRENTPEVALVDLTVAPERYPPAEVRAALDGPERLALEGSTQGLRVRAAVALASFGRREQAGDFGPVERLERLYRQSSERVIRNSVVGALHFQTTTGSALRLLEEIATARDGGPEMPEYPNAYMAVLGLAKMEERGRAVLGRLDQTGAAVNPRAKGLLDGLAENGYRLPTRRP